MFIDYATLVLKDYNQKKDVGRLSIRLSQPSPAKLRDECLALLEAELLPCDEQILRTFFGPAIDKNALARNIRSFDIDKLKPLANYLKKQNIDTDAKNVELLAWLLQFPNRPFKLGQKYKSSTDREIERVGAPDSPSKKKELEADILKNEEEEETLIEDKNSIDEVAQTAENVSFRNDLFRRVVKGKRVWGIAVVLAVGILLSFLLSRQKKEPNPLGIFSGSAEAKYMYWDGKQYQLVTSDKELGDTPIFKLDTFKYNHLKRITTPDTITYNAKGYVWYIKIDGDIEYYTSGGVHPLHADRHLKPISNYMINKYIRPNN